MRTEELKPKINGKTKTIKCKLIIGADGTPSTIARKLNLYSGRKNTIGFCFQYQMELSNEQRSNKELGVM